MSNQLSKYFIGIGAKRLSQVEIKPEKSHQHEFNATKDFKEIFGEEKTNFSSVFILLNDNDERIINQSGTLTWYDSRINHATRSEFRFYYSDNDVITNASPGDLMIIGRTGKKSVAVIVAPMGSTSEKQLLWLFGLAEVGDKFIPKKFNEDKKDLGFAAKYIISSMGFDPIEEKPDYLELILSKFGKVFPKTIVFSDFTRNIMGKEVDPINNPDEALVKWMDFEQTLFKTLEKHLVEIKLATGFGKSGVNVEDFIKFSLSIHQRRKSRAGYAFENHLSYIFNQHKLRYSHGKKTELNIKPDFLFPSVDAYKDRNFSTELLTMLGLKTTAKDRWRQIVSEANRISPKHLITLEPAISKNQTDEMKEKEVQLVIPIPLLTTYNTIQRKQIVSLTDFIQLVKEKEARA